MSVALAANAGPALKFALLRSRGFDGFFVLGTAAIAFAGGLAALHWPQHLMAIVFIDMLLIGFHHLLVTYTRLALDEGERGRRAFLAFALPLLVLPPTFMLTWTGGLPLLISVYFYWQSFHYARQGYGVERMYWRRSGREGIDRATQAVIYAFPLWGVLHRSFVGQSLFIGVDIVWVAVPQWLALAAGALALASFGWWLFARARDLREGRLAATHAAFVLTHVAVFAVGYRLIEDLTTGWLIVNIWHNLQYIAIVWLFQANRFDKHVPENLRWFAAIVRPANSWLYFGLFTALGALVYLGFTHAPWVIAGVPVAALLAMTLNFHHYIVDALIWRLRRKPVAQGLGV